MGNKQGKLEGGDRTDSKKKKSASVHDITGTHNDHGGGGNTASPFVRDFRSNGGGRAGYKRYQSYSGPSSSGSGKPRGGGSPSEGKSYQQNPASAPTGGRYRSLPRNAGTSSRNRSQSVTSNVYQSNGTLNGEPVDADGHVTYKRYAHIPATGHHSNMNDTIRPSTTRLNSAYSGHGTTGYRHGSNYRDDFPDTGSIKRRLTQFETQFEKYFTTLYSRLDETVQLDCVPVALCLGGPSTRPYQVSLYQYLTSDAVPQDLNQPHQTGRDRYVLSVPEALFQDAKRTRSQRVRDQTRWLSLAKEIASGVAVEVAEELSRMFEYQIALLGDGAPVDLLAGHAVQSAVEYVRAGNGFLERSTLIAGVLGGGPASTRVFPVFVGGRELKWNLSQIFQKCGLRKETLLFGPRPRDSTKFVPWTHHESADSMAQVYGYRGIALDRDPVHSYYVVVREDEIQFASSAQAARRSPDDVHTRYCPYRRLIGKEVMDEYCRSTKDTASVTLGEYVSKLQGYEYSRDVIQPVYRPLGMVSGLSKGSRIGTSVSSLLTPSSYPAGAATTSRATGGRHEERDRRPRSQFANGEQAQAPVFLRNNSTSSPNGNGHAQRYHPRSMGRSSGERGYRSESCSVTSEDFGEEHGGYGEGGGGTFARNDAHQQRRHYQSQRPNSSKSVSAFNTGTMPFNYMRPAGTSTSPIYAAVTVNCKPGPGFDQVQTVNRGSTSGYHGPPKSPDSGFNQTLSRGSTMANNPSQKPEQEIGNSAHSKDREFLDFKAFLGMIKQDENDEVVPEINSNDKSNSMNGHYGTAKHDLDSSGPRRIGVYSHESNKANDNSASSINDGVYNNRRPALSHI